MSFLKRFRAWLDEREDRRRYHESALFWHRAGALSPYSEAIHERALRLKLEEFRNYASRRYLEDSSLLPDDLKDEWLKAEIGPMAKSELTRDNAKAIKAGVLAMGEEMFVGLAARRRKEYIDAAIADARRQAPGLWTAQRERALQT